MCVCVCVYIYIIHPGYLFAFSNFEKEMCMILQATLLAIHEVVVLYVAGTARFQWGFIYLYELCEEVCEVWWHSEWGLPRRKKEGSPDAEP